MKLTTAFFLIVEVILLSTINVFAQLTASFTFVQTNGGCSTDSVVFTNTSTGAQTYKWDFGDFSPTDTAANPYHLYWQGLYIVELTAYDSISGDSDITTALINVVYTPDPWWAFFITNPISPICLGTSIDFDTFIFPGPDYYIWDFGDGDSSTAGSPVHLYAGPGTYVATLVVGNACGSSTYSDTIVISTTALPPTPFLSLGPDPVCPNTDVEFNNYGWPAPDSTRWLFGDGDSSGQTNTSHAYAAGGTYNVSLTVSNACADTTVFAMVTVDSMLIPSVWMWATPDTSCPGDTVLFFSNGTNLQFYSWDFGDGESSLQKDPEHTYASTGVYNVVFKGTNSCGNSDVASYNIVVDNAAKPQVSFSSTPSSFCPTFSNICPGSTVTFSNGSTGDVSWSWDFGDGNTSTNSDPTHIYVDTGNFNVKLVAMSSCSGTDSLEQCVRVVDNAVPFAYFCTNPFCFPFTTICIGGAVQFYNWSSDTLNCFWDFGDGDTSNLPNPSHIYADTGSYAVYLTITNGCGNSDTYVQGIKVNNSGPGPQGVDFGIFPASTCPGEDMSFNDWSWDATYWIWDFGDGDTSNLQFPFHAYSTSGTYTVTFIAGNTCDADTVVKSITVKPGPIPNFSFTSLCFDDTTVFTDMSTPTPDTWAWDFGDGNVSTLQNPSHYYITQGTYNISLMASAGSCAGSITKQVVIGMTLSATSVDANCGSADGSATVSVSGGNLPLTYLWNDLSAQTTTTAASLVSGTYVILVTDSLGCTETDTVVISDIGAGVASIASNTDALCFGSCDGDATASISGGTSPFTYLWDDPAAQMSITATALCSGTVNVTITDSLNCTSSASVVVNEPSAISITFTSVDASCGGSNGSATAVASGGTSPYTYLWDDPGMQTNATATSLSGGSYTVLITDANDCIDSILATISNIDGPTAIVASTDVLCNGGTDGTATVTAAGGTLPYTYLWSDPLSQSTATATGLMAGSYTSTLTDSAGCITFSSATITEPTTIVLSLTETPASSGNSDGAVDLTVAGGTPSYSYNWSSGATTEDLDSVLAGTYVVTVMDSNGCTVTDSVAVTTIISITTIQSPAEITVFPNPNAGKFIVTFNLTEEQQVTLTLYSIAGQIIIKQRLVLPSGETDHAININGHGRGVYNLRIVLENEAINKLLIIE